MNSILLFIILVPIIEIYLLIKVGAQIGAITTIILIFITAIIGVYYAKYEGLNTLKSAFVELSKNITPAYEVVSAAAIAFGALLLIVPGFFTDFLGFTIILPITRKFLFRKILKNFKYDKPKKNNFIDGEFEDIEEENNDRKI